MSVEPGELDGGEGVAERGGRVDDDELSRHLDQVVARERPTPLSLDIQLDDRRCLEGCSIAGPLGGRNGVFWFTLEM